MEEADETGYAVEEPDCCNGDCPAYLREVVQLQVEEDA